MLPSETQACASVTSAFLQVRPTCDRRAPHAQTRDVFLFSVLFADCASARCRVCLSTRKRRDGFRNAIVWRVGARPRPRALDRARSVACASPRWTRFAYLGVFSRARRAEEHRATPFEAVSVSLGASDASRVTTRREGGKVKPRHCRRTRKTKKEKKKPSAPLTRRHPSASFSERAHPYSART